MAKTPAPERIMHQGREMLLVTAEDYASLSAARRQAGAQSNRLRVLSHELLDVIEVLDALESRLSGDVPQDTGSTELLERVRARAQSCRALLGRGASR
jgi:hypothetical protein